MAKHAEEHLRRFVAARERGDAHEMRRWWEQLVIDFHDRMDGLVAGAHKGRLDDDEHELAVQLSLTRFSVKLIHSFEGVSIGQLVNACKTLARGICIDVQRTSIRERRAEAHSIDDPDGAGWEVGAAERRHGDDERAAEVRDFLAWALPQIAEERRRVLELTFYGAELHEIAETLGITRDNAYQRRSRAMGDLKRLKERYDA